MASRQSIVLSFFELNNQDFTFTVYRLPYVDRQEATDYPGLSRYPLPTGEYDDKNKIVYKDYWVSFSDGADLEAYDCSPNTCNPLTCLYLFNLLKDRCEHTLTENRDYTLGDEKFRVRRIEFIIEKISDEGRQVVWLEPYFLRSARCFGFLADFRFHADENVPYSHELQKYSLSLDKDGHRNKNFYSDKFNMLDKFLLRYGNSVFDLSTEITIKRELSKIGHRMLSPKRYIFAENNESGSQFMGMKEYGPFRQVDTEPMVYFIYRPSDHTKSQSLYLALNGVSHSRTFLGMSRMFKYTFDKSNVAGIEISDFSIDSVSRVLESLRKSSDGRPVVPLFISPLDEGSREYFEIKRLCLFEKIACQFVSLNTIDDSLKLKWAVSNIALQLFCKMGGIPWIVQPKTTKSLIIGIGQAHQLSENGNVDKYFAYTVLTEASGLYKELKVLGNTADSREYLQGFRRRLGRVLEHYYDEYDNFVIHTTFKIKHDELDPVDEMKVLKEVLDNVDSKNGRNKLLVILKFNRRNKYFAYSEHSNSRIPFESTCIRLGYKEFLIWFEGLQYHRPTVADRIEQPMHVEFVYESDEIGDSERLEYLQDALSLSGANWRGFNAKSVPVSVNYASLVAKFYREFQSLNESNVDYEALFENIRPWFL